MWWMRGSFFILLPTSSTSPPLIGLLGFDSGVAAAGSSTRIDVKGAGTDVSAPLLCGERGRLSGSGAALMGAAGVVALNGECAAASEGDGGCQGEHGAAELADEARFLLLRWIVRARRGWQVNAGPFRSSYVPREAYASRFRHPRSVLKAPALGPPAAMSKLAAARTWPTVEAPVSPAKPAVQPSPATVCPL